MGQKAKLGLARWRADGKRKLEKEKINKLFSNFVSIDLNLNQRFKWKSNTYLNSTKFELSLKT
jgi:hypothetical protein